MFLLFHQQAPPFLIQRVGSVGGKHKGFLRLPGPQPRPPPPGCPALGTCPGPPRTELRPALPSPPPGLRSPLGSGLPPPAPSPESLSPLETPSEHAPPGTSRPRVLQLCSQPRQPLLGVGSARYQASGLGIWHPSRVQQGPSILPLPSFDLGSLACMSRGRGALSPGFSRESGLCPQDSWGGALSPSPQNRQECP